MASGQIDNTKRNLENASFPELRKGAECVFLYTQPSLSATTTMEQFLLKNAELYQNLVSNLTPSTATPNISSLTGGRREQARTSSTHHVADPNMVVSARIRPFLDEDVAAGFPNAMFPRTADGEGEGQQKQGVVDIHDLYNHPRGRPLLRVIIRASRFG